MMAWHPRLGQASPLLQTLPYDLLCDGTIFE
jgi:hypothetical protein